MIQFSVPFFPPKIPQVSASGSFAADVFIIPVDEAFSSAQMGEHRKSLPLLAACVVLGVCANFGIDLEEAKASKLSVERRK